MSDASMRGFETALLRFMEERDLSREAATIVILQDWLSEKGYVKTSEVDNAQPGDIDPEQVQYPGYAKGEGSL